MPTPRVFLIRHGETEWSLSGQHTGKTDIPMTARGEAQVKSTGKFLYGSGKLLDPAKIAKVYVSPRIRAKRTYELLSGEGSDYEVVENLAEWDYGEYEGLVTSEIRAKRKEAGLDQDGPWDIWTSGCVGGESPSQVTSRIDTLISDIRTFHASAFGSEKQDIIIVAHGHLTRAFAKRWLGYELAFPLSLMMEPGGVGILSYQHGRIEEPALLLGMGFPVESV